MISVNTPICGFNFVLQSTYFLLRNRKFRPKHRARCIQSHCKSKLSIANRRPDNHKTWLVIALMILLENIPWLILEYGAPWH